MKIETKRWLTVVAFAIAMAWVESAVVFDLRTLVDRIQPYQPNPLPEMGDLGAVELMREAATLVMLLTVGALAGRSWRRRIGYSAVAFGVWDIGYYVFLNGMCGWPHSVKDWDILFLLPLPWWGPVLAPLCIAVLMIVWGTLASQFDDAGPKRDTARIVWALNFAGIAVALYVFMADTLRAAPQGADAVRRVLPERFDWSLFCLALGLMSAPVGEIARRLYLNRPAGTPAQPSAGRTLPESWNPDPLA